MKIAVFSDTFYPQTNGVVTSIINSSKELAKKENEIMIFAPKPKSGLKKKINFGKNIQVSYSHSLPLPAYKDYRIAFPGMITCLRKIRRFRPDVIHLHSPFSMGIQAFICAKVFNIPLVGTYHTLFPEFIKYLPVPKLKDREIAKKMTWRYTNLVYNRCSIITTPSLAMKKELVKYKIKKPIKVISNGIDLSKFQRKENKNIRKKFKLKENIILHFGRISYEKSIDVVLKAFKLVLKTNPATQLLIVGDGPALKKLKNESKELNISENIIFTGFVKEKELLGLISSSDIFVTASSIETQGLVILEAMACRLPVVAVKSRAIPELVRHNKNGFLAKPFNEREMGKYLNKLLENKKLQLKMGSESARVAKKHSLEFTADMLYKLYGELRKGD